ncbi:MAG: DNA-binding protein [Bacteroidales bacterium]|nr:DNA-binding protein [Bacteroidales bacterium]
MKFTEATAGRIFILRLENREIIHESIERFALEHNILRATLTVLGGIDKDSRIIVGPEADRASAVRPVDYLIRNMHEVTGTGTIFPDKNGKPVLHLHIACGRRDQTITGDVRHGVKVWHVLEIIITELKGSTSHRIFEESSGFELLNP